MQLKRMVFGLFLFLVAAVGAEAQQTRYDAYPSGDAVAPAPSVLTLRIDPAGPRAIVRKTDGGAFQTSGTMYLYQNGSLLTSVSQSAGVYSITIPFSFNFTSGTSSYYVKSSNNPYNSATVSVTATPVYKVGVVLFRHGRSIWEVRADLETLRTKIAASRPRRFGNGREAHLVVQLEVPWNETEYAAGYYDFSFYQQFARVCEELQIKWTPLLSPHYVPAHISSKYAGDRVTNMQGGIVDPAFLKFSPSSAVWGAETANWARAFIQAMRYDSGYNHFGRYAAIEEVLVGNEILYPTDVLTSRDPASQAKWAQRFPGYSYPTTFTTNFRTFRAEQLSYAINAMMSAVKSELTNVGATTVGVSSKLVPYLFPRSDDWEQDRWGGYTDSSISFLNSNFKELFAIDSYGSDFCNGWYPYTRDYSAARNRTSKPIYVAEFNREKNTCTNPITRSQVYNAAVTGFNSYNVRAFVLFAHNPTGTDAVLYMNDDQAAGLGDALNWLVP